MPLSFLRPQQAVAKTAGSLPTVQTPHSKAWALRPLTGHAAEWGRRHVVDDLHVGQDGRGERGHRHPGSSEAAAQQPEGTEPPRTSQSRTPRCPLIGWCPGTFPRFSLVLQGLRGGRSHRAFRWQRASRGSFHPEPKLPAPGSSGSPGFWKDESAFGKVGPGVPVLLPALTR